MVQVICQPDRPKGRGHRLQVPPVKAAALALGLPLWQPERIRDEAAVARFESFKADVGCVVAYGQILPPRVLEAPRLGCVNVHASLLPRWRGAAPIEWAVAEGDAVTGVCVQRMVERLDAGAVLLSRSRPLGPADEAHALHGELAEVGAALLLEALAGLEAGTLRGLPQDEAAATLAPRLKKSDGFLDPTWTRRRLCDRVRAFKVRPGAYIQRVGGERLKVLSAADAGPEPVGPPGLLVSVGPQGLRLACADGSIWLREVQAPGARVLAGADYARGRRLEPGARFERPAD
jgi:methionyl-tRNA formyltransferase